MAPKPLFQPHFAGPCLPHLHNREGVPESEPRVCLFLVKGPKASYQPLWISASLENERGDDGTHPMRFFTDETQKVLDQCPAQSEYSGGVTKRAHGGPLRGEAPQTEPVWKYKQITLPSLQKGHLCTQSHAREDVITSDAAPLEGLSPLLNRHRNPGSEKLSRLP